jgi:formimidoylglutamate deiminase
MRSKDEAARIAQANAIVCACPTTERNLGDGVVPAHLLTEEGVRIAFGSDSHTQIDLMEDARQLEYNLRLTKLERNVLAPESSDVSTLASRLFDGTTIHGAGLQIFLRWMLTIHPWPEHRLQSFYQT